MVLGGGAPVEKVLAALVLQEGQEAQLRGTKEHVVHKDLQVLDLRARGASDRREERKEERKKEKDPSTWGGGRDVPWKRRHLVLVGGEDAKVWEVRQAHVVLDLREVGEGEVREGRRRTKTKEKEKLGRPGCRPPQVPPARGHIPGRTGRWQGRGPRGENAR